MTTNQRPVVAGVDGQPEDLPVLRWAAWEAAGRHTTLRVVHARKTRLDFFGTDLGYGHRRREDTQTSIKNPDRIVDRAMEYVRLQHGGAVPVFGGVTWDIARRVLVGESQRAAVVVIGPPRRGGLAGTLHASVGGALSARTQCPVVVVKDPEPTAGVESAAVTGPVVVGVDGGPHTADALAFAFEHAARHALPLRAVSYRQSDPDGPVPRVKADRNEHGGLRLSMALTRAQHRYPQVALEQRVVREPAVRGLVMEAAHASLLVVGGHGRHPGLDGLLGSVSRAVLRQATCPVAIVPPAR